MTPRPSKEVAFLLPFWGRGPEVARTTKRVKGSPGPQKCDGDDLWPSKLLQTEFSNRLRQFDILRVSAN